MRPYGRQSRSKNKREVGTPLYTSKPVQQSGWYEAEPTVSLEMITNCDIDPKDPILDVGGCASTLIDALLARDYANLTAVDISTAVLDKLKVHPGEDAAAQVNWQVTDITKRAVTAAFQGYPLWHERAMLHFLTEEAAQQTYRTILAKALRPGGIAIIAVFAKEGASKCSGTMLPA